MPVPKRVASLALALSGFLLVSCLMSCHKGPVWNDANNSPIRGMNLLIRAASNEEMCIDAQSTGEIHPTVQLFHCHGRENQRFSFLEQGESSQITGIGGLCLDVQGQHSNNGTPLQLYPCSGAPNQRFRHEIDGRLREVQTGKCLTVSDFTEHAGVFIDDCAEKKKGQVWVIAPR
jgi:hypothetical protein